MLTLFIVSGFVVDLAGRILVSIKTNGHLKYTTNHSAMNVSDIFAFI